MGPCIADIFPNITNKMQLYTIYLFLWNALRVSGGTSTHHQELKTVCTASGTCQTYTTVAQPLISFFVYTVYIICWITLLWYTSARGRFEMCTTCISSCNFISVCLLVSKTKRLESSATRQWEPQISDKFEMPAGNHVILMQTWNVLFCSLVFKTRMGSNRS
jgi:hypothetical protein